jgi:hypothetical protein
MEIKVHGIYQHYKGDKYLVEDIALNSDTLEEYVVYRSLYGKGQLWVRPLAGFIEEVNKNGQQYRYQPLEVKSVREDK